MNNDPPKWMRTFGDRSVLLDAYRAARSCMGSICDDPPDDCRCDETRITPLEFVEWMEAEIRRAGPRLQPAQGVVRSARMDAPTSTVRGIR